MLFHIGGIQKTTLIDYPQKVAAVVFTQGCNFRCGYCHNPELLKVDKSSEIDCEDFFRFLETRQNKLDGVVITGGEPTLQSGLYGFIEQIKELGFDVKLDTNGTNPSVVRELLAGDLVDYIAMDIKAPYPKYSEVTGVRCDIDEIKNSVELILNSSIDYEFRTTVVRSMLSESDIIEIGKMISGARLYYLQKFVASKIYDIGLAEEKSYTDDELNRLCRELRKYVDRVEIR